MIWLHRQQQVRYNRPDPDGRRAWTVAPVFGTYKPHNRLVQLDVHTTREHRVVQFQVIPNSPTEDV